MLYMFLYKKFVSTLQNFSLRRQDKQKCRHGDGKVEDHETMVWTCKASF